MDIGSSQHSGSISGFIGGSSHSYPYMPEIGDSSVKKAAKKPRASANSSRAENHSRDGTGLTVFGHTGNSPSESEFPSVCKDPTVGNPPSGDESPNGRAKRHQWINPFCREPENDLSTCCLGFWLPCCLYGKTQHRLLQISEGLDPLDETMYKPSDGACWGFACVELWFGASCVFATLDRTRIRAMYNIQGTIAGDVLTTMCCTRCALMQHDREIRAREQLAATNGEKPNRSGTIYDQPSRHPDLGYAAPLFSDPSSTKKIPHRSSLVREKPTEASVEVKAQKFEKEKKKEKEQPKGHTGGNKLRKLPKIHPGGEDYNKKGKDSTSPKSLESSVPSEKSARNPSPLGSALNPITQSMKVDPGDRNDIISSRQPWRGHGMTIKPSSKPKRNSDQEMDYLALKTSQHPVTDCAREGNDNRGRTTDRRVVFKGSDNHSDRVNTDSRLPKEPALVNPSQRRSSLATSNAHVSDPTKDSTADESVLVYYSDGEVPQRHRLRDCARLRASTIGRPETHRENRVLSDCVSDDVTSTAEQPEVVDQDSLVESTKVISANAGQTEEHRDISHPKGDGHAHNNTKVEASSRDDKRPEAVSQHSLNECVVEHIERIAGPRPVQPVLQHHLADCGQVEFEPENTNVVNVSQHSISDCATIEDIESTRVSGRGAALASGNNPRGGKRRGGTIRGELRGSCSTDISLDGPEALVAPAMNAGVTEDASQQENSSLRTKSPEVIITSMAPTRPDGAESTKAEGHRGASADRQIERKPSETPSEATHALRRALREPTPREPSLSHLLDGTTDVREHTPIRSSRIRGGRENGKRMAPY